MMKLRLFFIHLTKRISVNRWFLLALIFLCQQHMYAQEATVSGKVSSGVTNEGMPGVNVVVKGTTIGTTTDANGKYAIRVSGGNDILVFSSIGYISEEVSVGNKSVVDVSLAEDLLNLTEVTIVGYGTQQKKDVTGAISSVKGSDFQNLPQAGASQALQGRAAGVNVIRNSGAPGDGGSIRIRGIGTVNDANPLTIIDGVPAGSINDVNPNDIESMEILKDASASAIYGTRASNGVIIVTTKRGKFDEKLKFTINGYTGVSNRLGTIDMLDASTLAELKRERYKNDELPVNLIWEDQQYQTQKTNWQDELLGKGTIKNFDVSVRGGSKNSTFSLSGGAYDEKGMIKKSYFQRYTFRLNSDHKIGKLKIGQNIQMTNQKGNAPNTTSAQDGLLWSAIRFHPGLPVKLADGSYSSSEVSGEFGDINNPIYTVDNQDRESVRNRILGSLTGEFDILPGLSAKANLALDATFSNSREFEVKINDQIRKNQWNQLTLRNDKYWSVLQEYFLTYNKKIADHSVTVVGGYTFQTFRDIYSATRGRDFSNEDPDLRYMRFAESIVALGNGEDGGRSYDALQSWFARGNYSFKDRYLLTLTFRADGSSRFASNNRWGYFPAFSLGWRISEENFFQGLSPVVNNLKLTGGWGHLGNQNVTSLQYLALISSGYRYSFGDLDITGSAQSRIPNINIGWETAEMTNFGLESGFLKNSILANINYFIKDTKNMLLSPPSVGTFGRASIPDQNVGQLRNQGLELELSYRQTLGDLTFSFGGNATFIKNKVTKLFDGNFLASQTYGRSAVEITRTYEGHPFGTFYGWRTNGLYQNVSEIESDPDIANDPRREAGQIQPGDVRFKDLNGDGIVDDQDREIIGSPQPKVTYGFNANATYKGFDLTLFFLGVGGVDIYNADRMQGIDPTYPFNMYAETTGRWHGEGTSNTIPRMTTKRDNLNHRTSDLFVERGDFLRLKNITLGYTIPSRLTNVVKVSQARLYATGQNIFTATGYSGLNPELGYVDGNRSQGQYSQLNVDYAQYPQARSWTIGASISF